MQEGMDYNMKQPAPSPNGLRGQNILEDGHHKTIMESFFEQLNDPLIFILFIAAAISMLLGEVSDTAIILAVMHVVHGPAGRQTLIK